MTLTTGEKRAFPSGIRQLEHTSAAVATWLRLSTYRRCDLTLATIAHWHYERYLRQKQTRATL